MKYMTRLGVSLRNICTVVVVASMTSGCIMYRLEELRNTTPSGNAFQTELSGLYMDFATRGEKEYDWSNSWHFADKGLMLAYGQDAGPEDLNDWDIPEEALPDLQKAREELMSVLTPKNIENAPRRAASAQFYFDCWVKYQEPNWQFDEIAFCRDHLEQELEGFGVKMHHSATSPVTNSGSLKKAAAVQPETKPKAPPEIKAAAKPEAKLVAPAVAAPAPVAVVAPEAVPLKPIEAPIAKEPEKIAKEPTKEVASATLDHAYAVSYAVFFDAGKPQLSAPGQSVISEVVDLLKHEKNYEVILHTAATKEMSEALATQRAQVVKTRLIESGVDEKAVKMSSLSQDAAHVGANGHRVDIFLNE